MGIKETTIPFEELNLHSLLFVILFLQGGIPVSPENIYEELWRERNVWFSCHSEADDV